VGQVRGRWPPSPCAAGCSSRWRPSAAVVG